jgi:hypothetical protein
MCTRIGVRGGVVRNHREIRMPPHHLIYAEARLRSESLVGDLGDNPVT